MEYKDLLVEFLFKFLKAGFYIYIPAQAFVYLSGRMLGAFNSHLTRNLIAFASIVGMSFFYIYMNFQNIPTIEIIYECIQYSSIGILYYTLLGFHLYDRIDHLLDKKIAPDEQNPNRKFFNKKKK